MSTPTTRPAGASGGPRAACLGPAGITGPLGRRLLDIKDAGAVLEGAVSTGYRQVWIGPSVLSLLGLPPSFEVPTSHEATRYKYGIAHPWAGAARAAGWTLSTEPAGLSPWVGFSRGDQVVDVVVAPWDQDNPFGAAETAPELLGALELYAAQLGLRYRRSPGASGLALMRAVHSGRGGIALPETGTPAPPAVAGIDSEAVGSWLSPTEPEGEWLHGWDLNGMYLAACSSAELGFGEAVHHPRAHVAGREFNEPGRAGYWRATIDGTSSLPLPFKADGKLHWYTAPTLELAGELGLVVRLRECWVYPERRRWLEPWYARLRDARTALMADPSPAGRLALEAVKATYTRTLGRLAGHWLEVGDATFRPDWRDVVITRARANMHRHLRKATAAPMAISADAVVFSSPHEDPADAGQALGLEVGAQLGKWKHTGRLPRARWHRKAYRSKSTAIRALLDALEPV